MKTLKLYLVISTSLLVVHTTDAQQVYQSTHYGTPGDVYLYNRFASGFSNEGMTAAGANITWDMSTNTDLNTHVNQVVEPGEAIDQFTFLTVCALSGLSGPDCFDTWNATDQCVELKDSLQLLDFTLYDLQRYQTKTNNLLLENFIGFKVDLGGLATQAVIVYQNPDTTIQFPIAYGIEWTSHTTYGLDLNPAGQNILYSADQSRITTMDGWGTLMTPYDTFVNVVRLRSDILRLDTIVQDGTDTITLVADQVEYMWLDTNYSLPVMTANGIITPNDAVIINELEYIYESTCPAPTWVADTGADTFYIGPTGDVTINFNIQNSNADTYSWDFGDGQFLESTGPVAHDYNVPGEYAMSVIGCMTNCLPLNSCSFQILDFFILDTTTSVITIPGEKLGIKLYPNPITDQINLYIPEKLGAQQYELFDSTGRLVKSGRIDAGNSTTDIKDLSEGVYSLQMRSSISSGRQVAIMRCMVLR
jgi:hypothetical protein